MKVKCIDSHNRFDYTIGNYYNVKDIYEAKDFIFDSSDRIETYYMIYDNYNDLHTFNKLGFEMHFISVTRERKKKLDKIKEI